MLGWFTELNEARSSNGSSLNPVGYADIHAWCVLTGVELTAYELGLLRQLDGAFLKAMRKANDG
jgi:hypothetical protein